MIDLGEIKHISGLEIINRIDACQYRAKCLSLELLNNRDELELPFGIPLLESAAFLSGAQQSLKIELPKLKA